jgi:hypothetical protein
MDKELELQQELIDSPPRPYTNLIRHEWGDFAGGGSDSTTAHIGKGDLVFQRPNKEDYLVVETKYLRTDSGSNARTSRTGSRRKVMEQAFRYGAIWRACLRTEGGTVTVATYTNDGSTTSVEPRGCYDDDATITTNTTINTTTPQSRLFQVLGQVDYLTPKVLGVEHFGQVLSPQEEAMLKNEQYRNIFMVVRIPLLKTEIDSYAPETFQVDFEYGDFQPEWATPDMTHLVEIANATLNNIGSNSNSNNFFYQPFTPHFIVAPNHKVQLLRTVQAYLHRLKR